MTLDRRVFLSACGRAGITSAFFPGVLYTLAAQAQEASGTDQSKPPKVTSEMVDQAAILAGVGPFTQEQKKMMIDGLVDQNGAYQGDSQVETAKFSRASIRVSSAASKHRKARCSGSEQERMES